MTTQPTDAQLADLRHDIDALAQIVAQLANGLSIAAQAMTPGQREAMPWQSALAVTAAQVSTPLRQLNERISNREG